jgi:DNA adenine methylase
MRTPEDDRGHVVNVASVPHRSVFRYPGGKTWLVPHVRRWLTSLPRKRREFAEPFAGGGIVALTVVFENLAEHATLVERDADVGAVWRTLVEGNGPELAGRIEEFEMSREAAQAVLATPPRTVLDRAFATIVRNRVQRGGILAEGASLMKSGEDGRGIASRWYPQTLSRRIHDIHARRNRIAFVVGDGIEFLRANAHREGLVFYIDPPYTVAGRRLYTHCDLDHEELFAVTATLRGDFLMSYDNAEPIRELAKRAGFDTREVAMKNTHHAVMSELLIGRDLGWARS